MEQEWIQSAYLLLPPVLYLLGLFFKRASGVHDRHIPLLLGAAGAVLGVALSLSAGPFPETAESWLDACSTGVMQGILSAGAAVYGNQIFKQAGKNPLSPEEYLQRPGGDAQ